MNNKHFADLAPDECPSEIPHVITSRRHGCQCSLVGAWRFPPEGERPELYHVRYDEIAPADGEKPKKELPWYHAIAGDAWEIGLAGHTAPLYGLASIRAGKPIIVVEGEKAAAALHSIGVPAVGLPGKDAAKAVDLSPLDGLDTILWADNDPETGKKNGTDAMNLLAERLARAHRRIDPAVLDLPPKGDAADLLGPETVFDAAGLMAWITPALVDVAAPAKPEPMLKELPENWQAIGARPRDFVFTESRVPAKCTTLFSAAGGLGKSMIELAKALSITTGKTLIEHWEPVSQGRVVIVSSEDDMEEIARRTLRLFKAFGFDSNDNDAIRENLRLLCDPTFSAITMDPRTNTLIASDDLKRLADDLGDNPPQLIVMDPLSGIIPGLDENDNPTAKRVVGILDSTFQHTGAGLELVTHTSKAGRITGDSARGAGGWSDSSRQAWSVRPLDGNEKKKATGDPNRYVCLQCLKSNYGPKHGNQYFAWSEKHAGVLEAVNWDCVEQAIEEQRRDALTQAVLQVLGEFNDITKSEILSRASSVEGTKRGGQFRERVSDLVNAKVSTRMLEPILYDLMYEGRIVADDKSGQRNPLRLATLKEQNG